MIQKRLREFKHSAETECPTCDRGGFASKKGVQIHHSQVHGESLDVIIICEVCGKSFHVDPCQSEDRRFCSDKCLSIGFSDRVTQSCRVCGGDVEKKPSEVLENGKNPFCNQACYHKWHRENIGVPGMENPNWKSVLIECHWCGKEYYEQPHKIKRYEKNCCSPKCTYAARQGENSVVWEERIRLKCDFCNEGFKVPPAKTYRRFCSKSCWKGFQVSSRNTGPMSPHWKGGSGIYRALCRLTTGNWTQKRGECREKAGQVCEMCGCEEDGRDHDTHHAVPVLAGGTNTTELLLYLCRSCHRKAESYTSDLFHNLFDEQRYGVN